MSRSPPQGPSTTPQNTLRRRFRYMINFQLNNSTGSGVNQYSYYSKYLKFDPMLAYGFQDCKRTFELWRMLRAKVYVQPSYNDYNQSYNTINFDSSLATTIWTAADYGNNENISGVDVMSYDNARFHSLSLNKYIPIINTKTRLNNRPNSGPISILPAGTWLDTSLATDSIQEYNGFQIFAMMPGINANNYLPKYQMIVELTCEFKQPAWQNIPTNFESTCLGSLLECTLDDDDNTRMYVLKSYNRAVTGTTIRFEREDLQPGSLTYSVQEFYEVYSSGYNTSSYFGGRKISYTGPIPPKE